MAMNAAREKLKLIQKEKCSKNITKKNNVVNKPDKKQPLITSAFQTSRVLKLCGRVVVEDGRPFSNFDSEAMQEIIKLGKEGAIDASSKAINSENVKNEVIQQAEMMRQELIEQLKGKTVSLSSDLATAEGRSFFGKDILIVSFQFLILNLSKD